MLTVAILSINSWNERRCYGVEIGGNGPKKDAHGVDVLFAIKRSKRSLEKPLIPLVWRHAFESVSFTSVCMSVPPSSILDLQYSAGSE